MKWLWVLLSSMLGFSVKAANPMIITFQQDESDVLYDWLAYHSAIFGAHRIHVIDHNSTSAAVRNVLRIVARSGVHVTKYTGEFRDKGQTLTRIIKEALSADPSIDLVIPLDADEFIVAQSPTSPRMSSLSRMSQTSFVTSQEAVFAALDELPRDGFKFKFDTITAVLCNRGDTTADELNRRRVLSATYLLTPYVSGRHGKTFYLRDGFVSTDQGNHIGKVIADDKCETALDVELESVQRHNNMCFHNTRLALVHYGVKALGYGAWKRKMLRGAKAYGYSLGAPCESGMLGVHYCEFLKQVSEDEDKVKGLFDIQCSGGVDSDAIASALLGDRSKTIQY